MNETPMAQVLSTFTATLTAGTAFQLPVTTKGLVPTTLFNADGTALSLALNSAANLSAATEANALLVAEPGQWSITSFPATNTVASATKAAGGVGVRHVLQTLSFDLFDPDGATVTSGLRIVVRDGATGVGAILWNGFVSGGPTTVIDHKQLSGLNIIGSPNTAMTVEFVAAGGANTQEVLTATGYSTV